jgi:hypothetical protein
MAKQNCWEYKKCGREPGGSRVGELGVCPSATEKRLTGTHGGVSAGRACWVVGGTFCGGKVQGSYAQKLANCMECAFYHSIRADEGQHFQPAPELLRRLR